MRITTMDKYMTYIITPDLLDFRNICIDLGINFRDIKQVKQIYCPTQLYGRSLKDIKIIWGNKAYLLKTDIFNRLYGEVQLRSKYHG